MKTKLTFISLALLALLGAGMLMAFKQEESAKRYVILCIKKQLLNKYEITQIDEEGIVTEKSIKRGMAGELEYITDMKVENELINELSQKRYRLVGFKSDDQLKQYKYYFEKNK